MESIITDNMDVCFVCGGRASEKHHCIHSINRKSADKYGLFVGLCPECHRTSDKAVHGKNGHTLDLALKQIAQRKFEELYGHEKYMEVFGKNYL